MSVFQRRPDGEYRLCRGCEARGYGIDSWHPATSEFWRTENGRLKFSRCRACLADVAAKKDGVVAAREMAHA